MKTVNLSKYGVVLTQAKMDAVTKEVQHSLKNDEHVVLDFSGIKGIDSSAAQKLVTSLRDRQRGKVQLTNADPMVKSVLVFSGSAATSVASASPRRASWGHHVLSWLFTLTLLFSLAIGQMWAGSWSYNLSFYCIPGEIFGDNAEYHDMAYRRVSVGANDGTGTWREGKMTATGIYYKGYEIYSVTLTGWAHENAQGGASNIWFKLRHADTWETVYGEHGWNDWREMSYINGYIRTKDGWDIYKYDHTISAGSTIIWDMAGNESGWDASYIYTDINGGSGSNTAMTNLTGTNQYSITCANAINYVAAFQFRSNTDHWYSYDHTTNIERNVSGVTLFTNLNTSTDTDPRRLNWQVSENAKKATGGVKIYFDNTAANWSAIWLKYGTTWYNRKSASAASKVYGTDNLYVIEMPTDIYYAKYYLADNFGWVNYSDIEAAGDAGNIMSNRIASQESDLSSDITFIPSTGNSSTPKVWTTTTIPGHTREVTITAPSHGTITVTYTDESNNSQTKTATHGGSNVVFNVAQTCVLTVSAVADEGYELSGDITVGGGTVTSGDTYIVRSNISISATFNPQEYTLTLDHQGATNTPAPNSISVTYDSNDNLTGTVVTTLPTKTGYPTFGGYYTQAAGGGYQLITAAGAVNGNLTGYTSSGTWVKADDVTVYAKWTQTVALNANGGDEDGSVSVNYNATSAGTPSAPTRTGYSVEGYYAEAGCSNQVMGTDGSLVGYTGYVVGGKWVHTDATELFTNWTANSYDVTLDPNNGGSSSTISATYGSAMPSKLKDGETSVSLPSKTNYVFAGYYDAQGKQYYNGTPASVTNWDKDEDDVTLYGKWTQTITLALDGGSTEGVTSLTAIYGATLDLTGYEAPTKSGYDFGGFKTAAGNVLIDEDGIVQTVSGITDSDKKWENSSSALTLTAIWNEKTYTITLDKNLPSGTTGVAGAANFTVAYNSSEYSFGDKLSSLPVAEGYTFAGYYTDDATPVLVITAAGGVNTTTAYISGTAKWVHAGNVTLYAHWTNNGTYVFKGGASGNATSWSTAANWTKGVAPSENDGSEDIIILAPVEIPASATTNVNSVRIGTAGSYTPVGGSAIDAAGKLTIPATAMLKVTTNVQNYNFSNSSASATTESTLHIESASTGNGALVWGASGTPGRAQVDFYTKSSAAGNWEGANTDVNQYIGTPFSDANVLYNYYNAWTFKVNAAGTAWERMKGDETMYPFVGYDVIYDGAAGHIFEMDGTLVTNADKTCTLSHTTAGDENLLANSWTAPIWMKGFESSDFTNANAAIYIFNSTSEKASADAGHTAAVGGGNYEAFTPGTSGDDDYIQSMQSFSVLSSGGNGSVTLDYSDLVLDPASHSHIGAMHAPRRFADGETEPEEDLEPTKMDFLRLRVADTNGWADELKIYIREDFVEEFENGFDARKMYGDDRAPMLYGISPDGRMAINCIPTADNHVVGFHGGSASNEYTFRFAYDGEEELYLLDNKTGAETLISAEDTYSFTTEAGDNDLRFSIIRKTPAVPTDIETVTGEGLQTMGVQKIMYNGMLYILRSGRIYDATGAVVK